MKRSPTLPALVLLLFALVVGSVYFRPTPAEQKPVPRAPLPSGTRAPEMPPGTAEPKERPPTEAKAPAPAPPDVPQTPAPRIRTLHGVISDVAGRAVPFAKVEAFALDLQNTLTRSSLESNAQGEYRLECPDRTKVTLTAQAPGCGRNFAWVDFKNPVNLPNWEFELNLTLMAPTDFEGVLTDAEGKPAAGATLHFHPVSTKYLNPAVGDGMLSLNLLNGDLPGTNEAWDARCRKERFMTDGVAVTDGAGKFRAASLRAGTNYLIDVEREGRPTEVLETHVRGQKSPAQLKLAP